MNKFFLTLTIFLTCSVVYCHQHSSSLDSLYRLAYYESDIAQCEEYLAHFKKAVSKSEFDQKYLFEFYFLLGNKSRKQQDFISGINYYKSSFGIADQLSDINLKRKVFVNLSKTYRTLEDYTSAKRFTEKALEAAIGMNDDSLKARYLFDRGLINRKLIRMKESFKDLQASLNIYKSFNKRLAGLVLIEMGNVALELNLYDDAISHYYRALNLNDKSDLIRAKVYNNHSMALFLKKDTLKAIDLVKKSIVLKEKLSNSDYLIASWNHLGKYYFEQSNYDSAIYYLARAFDSNNLSGSKGKTLLEYKASINLLKKIAVLTDNKYLLFDLGGMDKHELVMEKFIISDKRRKKMALEVLNLIEDSEKRHNYSLFMVMLGFSLLIGGILSFYLVREKRAKKRRMELKNDVTDAMSRVFNAN